MVNKDWTMKICIKLQGNITQEPMELNDGTYSIGRSDQCDIVLDHQKISRKHAELSVDKEQFTLVDLASANGIYLKNKKISQFKSKKIQEFSMGDFSVIIDPENTSTNQKSSNILENILLQFGKTPRISVLGIQLILCFFIIIATSNFIFTHYKSVLISLEIERAKLIAQETAFANYSFWVEHGALPVPKEQFENEEGVVEVLLTNGYGQVLIPLGDKLKAKQLGIVSKVLKGKKPEVEEIDEDSYLVCHPVIQDSEIIGTVVLTYHIRVYNSLIEERFGTVLLGMFFLIMLSIISGLVILHVIITPLRVLNDAIHSATENRVDIVQFNASSHAKELSRSKSIAERLLLRAFQASLSHSTKTKSESAVYTQSSDMISSQENLAQNSQLDEYEIYCSIDQSTGNVEFVSPRLSEILDTSINDQVHIIELFQSSGILEKIMLLFDGSIDNETCILKEESYIISRKENILENQLILLIFNHTEL